MASPHPPISAAHTLDGLAAIVEGLAFITVLVSAVALGAAIVVALLV
ncbi:MAG: hypothetical protein QOJ21_3388 [Solirubrobacteraceae bacterium]|jgi:hypothetical protein|nr:hypothetical protein [Solirubrobacteraceae bacterium]